MAVGRVELTTNELEWLVSRAKNAADAREYYRAVRELERGLRKAQEAEARDRQNRARIQRNRGEYERQIRA